ncbi:T9SS type A sorting domain-containing protein [Hymenobacter sp. YC55]|uniref:T9SS type A sorting domain-containing protein n=1 Tax=Hymenobacter sp. YC55 TaxID=3034019 RepID=UPI0023F9EC98|nr:T9SS type A sorting domain-containing protein [Hymenobacter sp. YC55]MDF7814908.1 T9SS type A sorting domain-containing protein [Hymenobacter sp. YC55]
MKLSFTSLLLVAGWLCGSTTQAQVAPARTPQSLQLAVPAGAPVLRHTAYPLEVRPTKRLPLTQPGASRPSQRQDQARTVTTEAVTQAGVAVINYQPAPGFYFSLVDRVVDGTGNTYLTGLFGSTSGPTTGPSANTDFLVVKYSPSGQRLWERSYDNYNLSLGTSSDDRPVALAVDAAGNVIVTGSTSTYDRRVARAFAGFLTLKYTPLGDLAWIQNMQGARVSSILDLAVDAAGNAYVEGSWSSDFTTFVFQRVTMKYSPSGQQLWSVMRPETELGDTQRLAADASGGVCLYGNYTIKKYAGVSGQLQWTVQSTSDINDLRVDAAGNVLTTGTAANNYATVKYAGASGQRLWEANYDGPAHASDVATALSFDAEANVVVTGSSQGDNTNQDFATVRYDGATGQQLWVARANGSANGADAATALVLDRAGNVYVTGRSASSRGDNDFSTVKYTSAGQQQWQIGYNGPNNSNDVPTTIGLDITGNVYVGSGNTTVTYAQNSVQEGWAARFKGTGSSAEVAKYVATDAAGNVYVTGYAYNGRNYDYATVKYDANGQQQWEARFNGPADNEDLPTNVVVDAAGNVYVSGTSYSATESDYATIKYSSTGQQLWVMRYNGPANGYDLAAKVEVDGIGNVYVTGSSDNGSTSSYDYATLKYNTNGQLLWATRYNGPANSYDLAADLVVDLAGNVYVTGTTYSDAQSDYATLKYAPSGQLLWQQTYNGPGNGYDEAAKLALAGMQETSVVVTGTSDGGSSTGYDMGTTAYRTSTGQPQWNYRYNGLGNGDDVVADLAVSRDGNAVVVGTSYSSTGADYATHVLANGQLLWQACYNGADNSYDEAKAVAVDVAGNAYVTGLSYNADGTNDYATVKYGALGNGEVRWTAHYDGAGSYDEAAAIRVDASNNVYVTGYSLSPDTGYDFATLQYGQNNGGGPLPLTTAPTTSSAVIASAPLTVMAPSRELQELAVYPNPVAGAAKISFRPVLDGAAQVQLYNQLGQQVATLYEGTVHKGQYYELPLASQKLPAGLYTCSLLVDGQRQTVRVLVAH